MAACAGLLRSVVTLTPDKAKARQGLGSLGVRTAATGYGAGVRLYLVDEAVFEGFFRSKPAVTVGVFSNLLSALAGLVGRDFGHDLLHVQDQFRGDAHIRRAAPMPPEGWCIMIRACGVA